MSTQPTTQLVHWQDLKVFSETELVLKIAQQNGWKDCEIFGYGDMISQPLESMGWKLIPADVYEYSIPEEGVNRILQIINAGVRIQGVIIADDKRSVDLPKKPAKPVISLPSVKSVYSFIGKVLLRFLIILGVALIVFEIGSVLLFIAPLIILGSVMGYDPKLIILVDNGDGGITWVSVFTWYD